MNSLKGFAFVGFETQESQQAALSFKNFTIRNKLMSITPCVAPAKAKSITQEQESRALYLTGIINSLTEKDLVKSFSTFGKVEIARIIIDHSTMLTKGYGFVVMQDLEGHKLAVQAGHVYFGKAKIKVKKVTIVKNNKEKKEDQRIKNPDSDSRENTSSSKEVKKMGGKKEIQKGKIGNQNALT